ncbi:MAG: GNAT family N-acetyltransferase [Minwuia sp.]|uniref:GNAT family N-acetyltransferase n=1 Tax=Minwuia sp. TaxID=2493630 RepID=UPI003A8BC46C
MFAYTMLDDAARSALTALLDVSFGPDRHSKIAYRFRDDVPEDERFGMAAWDGDLLVGAIQYWPCHVDGVDAQLLGPLAVAPAYRGRGAARGLVNRSLQLVEDAGTDLVVLIGDPKLYLQYGFTPASGQSLVIEGEPDHRVQMKPLTDAGREATGLVSPALATVS